MNTERAGPRFKVGDRVRNKEHGWTGTVLRWTGYYLDVKQDDGQTWLLYEYEITPAPPAAKEAGPKYKVGDEFRFANGEYKPFRGTIVGVRDDNNNYQMSWCWTGKKDYRNTWSESAIDNQLVLVTTTEPQAQEEIEMQAYNWAIWNKDVDGEKLDIVDQVGGGEV